MPFIEKINRLIHSFKEISDVGLCFYDLTSFFHYNEFGERGNIGHYCEFCRCAHLLKGGRLACDKSDKGRAVLFAAQNKDPFFIKCYLGLIELIVPIRNEYELKGIVFVGQCRIENENVQEEISKEVRLRGGSPEHFIELYNNLPEVSRDVLLSIGEIIKLYFSSLTEINNIFPSPCNLQSEALSLPDKMADYCNKNYQQKISAKDVAAYVFVDQSYAARVFKNIKGITITDYLNNVRIKNAKRMLNSTNIPLKVVTINVGFSDLNYFSKVFKKYEGITPSEYRNSVKPLNKTKN